MKRVLGILLFLGLVAPSLATATPVCTPVGPAVAQVPGVRPSAQVVVNGTCFDLSDSIRNDGKPAQLVSILEVPDVARIITFAFLNPDPFINFGAITTNLTAAPVAYSFTFSTPVIATTYNHAASSGGVSLTSGPSGTSSVVSVPPFISGFGSLGPVLPNLGVDLNTPPACTAGATTVVCNEVPKVNSFAPTLFDNLEAQLGYTQTGQNSVAGWTGAVTLITVVAEPASMGLLAIGAVLVALGYRGMRHRPRA